MTRLFAIGLLCSALVGVSACNDDDVGKDCPMEAPPSNNGTATGSQFPADVEINTEFPCDSLTCVNTDGRHSYCSRECDADVNCPSAFQCSVVMDIGPLAGRKYCVWRGCRAQLECGDVAKYDCIDGDYGPLQPPGLCGPIGLKNDSDSGTDDSGWRPTMIATLRSGLVASRDRFGG